MCPSVSTVLLFQALYACGTHLRLRVFIHAWAFYAERMRKRIIVMECELVVRFSVVLQTLGLYGLKTIAVHLCLGHLLPEIIPVQFFFAFCVCLAGRVKIRANEGQCKRARLRVV